MRNPEVAANKKLVVYCLTALVDYLMVTLYIGVQRGDPVALWWARSGEWFWMLLWAVPATLACLIMLGFDVTDWFKKQRLPVAC